MLGVLQLWRACRTYRALPRGGGIADQDQYLMECLLGLDDIKAEFEAEQLKEAMGKK
jgi:hypothetical protein